MHRCKRLLASIIGLALIAGTAACEGSQVKETTEAISSIGKVSLSSKKAIALARQKYDTLSSEDKQKVSNAGTLKKASRRYEGLIKEQRCVKNLIDAFDKKNSVMEETTGSAQNWAKQTLQTVSDEKETLSNHDASEFVDASFREFLKSYDSSLQSQQDGLGRYPDDADAYNSKFIDSGLKIQNKLITEEAKEYTLVTLEQTSQQFLGKMDSLSKAVKIDTSKGQVEVTVEGFAIRPEDTVALQQFGEAGDDQECGYLLLIVKDISHPVSDDYSGHIRFDEIGTISDEEGVQRTSSDSSLKYPGYECGGGAAFGVYPGSDVQIGETKRISIPYVVNKSTNTVRVQMNDDSFLILPVGR